MILYVGSQLLSTLLTPTTPDRNQQMLMYGLPLVFAIFILLYEFPAGLLVYWITTNLWTVGQGYLLRKKLGPIMPVKLDDDDEDDDRRRRRRQGDDVLEAHERRDGREVRAGRRAAPPPPKPSGPPPPRSPRKKKKRSGRRR